MYVCKKCGNHDKFKAVETGNCDYTVDIIADNEGGSEGETGEYTYENHDNVDIDEMTCFICGSDDVDDMDDEEYQEWRIEFEEKEREKTNPTDWKGRYRYIKYNGKSKK